MWPNIENFYAEAHKDDHDHRLFDTRHFATGTLDCDSGRTLRPCPGGTRMTPFVIAIVLCAALMHATWNALLKGAQDRAVSLGLLSLGHVIPAAIVAAWLPLPPPEAWIYIAASTVIHWAYYYLLNLSYRLGDLSVVYPMARGAAPLMVAIGAQFWIGERLPLLAWIGIFAISCGIFLLARPSRHGGTALPGLAAGFATALTVAAYSIVDGIGVRLGDAALSYICWLFIAEAFVAAWLLGTRRDRLRALPARVLALGLLGGLISGAAYALALYAKTLAPIGMVSALRETSVIFAALIGVYWFGEGPRGIRIASAAVVASGIMMMALS